MREKEEWKMERENQRVGQHHLTRTAHLSPLSAASSKNSKYQKVGRQVVSFFFSLSLLFSSLSLSLSFSSLFLPSILPFHKQQPVVVFDVRLQKRTDGYIFFWHLFRASGYFTLFLLQFFLLKLFIFFNLWITS